MTPSKVSALVRTLNSSATLARCLSSLQNQTAPVEIIVVDSGSTDDTLDIARAVVDRVVTIRPGDFTYGGALNRGAEAATGEVLMPLSSHCWLPDPRWSERAVGHVDRGAAGATGKVHGPDGVLLSRPMTVDPTLAAEHARRRSTDPAFSPFWSFSNHASVVSRETWTQLPFDELIVASEDMAWADAVHADGGTVVYDPSLVVSTTHRRQAGVRKLFQRRMQEALGAATVRPDLRLDARHTLRRWYAHRHEDSHFLRATISPWRAVDHVAEWSAGRRIAREGPSAARVGHRSQS